MALPKEHKRRFRTNKTGLGGWHASQKRDFLHIEEPPVEDYSHHENGFYTEDSVTYTHNDPEPVIHQLATALSALTTTNTSVHRYRPDLFLFVEARDEDIAWYRDHFGEVVDHDGTHAIVKHHLSELLLVDMGGGVYAEMTRSLILARWYAFSQDIEELYAQDFYDNWLEQKQVLDAQHNLV